MQCQIEFNVNKKDMKELCTYSSNHFRNKNGTPYTRNSQNVTGLSLKGEKYLRPMGSTSTINIIQPAELTTAFLECPGPRLFFQIGKLLNFSNDG